MKPLLVRASGSYHIMTEPQGKSNLEKYNDLKSDIKAEYEKLAALKEGSKSYQNKQDTIERKIAALKFLEPIKNQVELSAGCKTHAIDLYVWWKYGRREEIETKYTKKGNAVEEDAITLLSLETKKFFRKNESRIFDEHLTGLPDIFEGETILTASDIWDTKSSWIANTFFRAKHSEINPSYYWQGQSYMALTGAKRFHLAYCLVNSPAEAIQDEIYYLKRRMNIMDIETPEFIAKAKQIEINHIFDIALFIKHYPHYQFYNDINNWHYDIPRRYRLHYTTIERNQFDIDRLYKRVEAVRDYIINTLMTND